MIRYGQDISTGTEISTSVCIVGSGAAGVTLAWYLDKAGIKVTLIDGSRDFDSDPYKKYEDKELLYNGKAGGMFASNEPNFLILPTNYQQNPSERERYFGGTTIHWGGQSRPLDPITFEGVEGYPSWPVTRKELQPFYDEAASFCKLHGANFSAEYWAQVLEAKVPDLPGFEVAMYQFMGGQYLNFANRTVDGQTLADSKIDVIRNASLLSIDYQQGSAQRLNVASIESGDNPSAATQFTIRADAYVLACGAVANARQLLLSDLNQSGKVGRYFMCHPLTSGVVSVTKPYLSTDEKRLMDGTKPNGQQWTDSNGVRVTGRFIPNADTTRQLDIGRCWFWANYNHYYFEQAPNPNSYITLGDGTDPVFGQPQTDITWEFCDLDEKTYNATTQLFQKDVSDRGGSVSFQSWSYVKANAVVNGHHLGTTRMSVDPADGVVDSNLRSHELNNLYVAGSSVWPSAGISNPTHTIIMFAIRLASHLSQEFGASGGAAD